MAAKEFLVDIDLVQNQIQRPVLHRLASAPAGTDGQLYYDTGTQLTYQYKGTPTNAWEVIGGSGTTNLSNTPSATNVVVESSSGSNTTLPAATTSLAGVMTAADKVILDSLDINAIRWQETDLLAGGPAGTLQWAAFLDEDNLGSNDDTKVASQQSIKAYVDNAVAGGVTYKGGYNAITDTPALEGTPGPLGILTGWMYTVTASTASTFFGEVLEVGDVLIAENDAPTTGAEWTIVQKNETDVVTSSSVSSTNLNIAVFDGTSGKVIKDGGATIASLVYTPVNASTTVKGVVEEATQTEVNAGTATGATGARLFVNPSTLDTYMGQYGLVERYETTVGDGASTSFVITHNLGTRFVTAEVYRTLTPWDRVECVIECTSTTTLTLRFNAIVTSNLYTVVVIG